MKNKKILIVEDDEITAMNLQISLQKLGYIITAVCSSISSAHSNILSSHPELILIDISLDDSMDGITLAQEVRDRFKIPFIFLTSYTDDETLSYAKVTEPYGYIVKPFDPNSLHATIQIALFKYDSEQDTHKELSSLKLDKKNLEKLLYSRKEVNEPIVFFSNHYHLDLSICETFCRGEKIKLTKKENAFLRLLVSQMGAVVSFEQAIKYVWEESGATENSVRTLVWRLRNKLEDDIIKNASGIGYIIEANKI